MHRPACTGPVASMCTPSAHQPYSDVGHMMISTSNSPHRLSWQMQAQGAPITNACMHERELSHLSMVAHEPRSARLLCCGRLAAAGRGSCLAHASLHAAKMQCQMHGQHVWRLNCVGATPSDCQVQYM
jgi:hypothetical protein